MAILQVEQVEKTYIQRLGGNQVKALRRISFSVEQGEYVAIMGESGSGKTTLLNILAALDKATFGRVVLGNQDLSAVPEKNLAQFRRENLGFVFQEFNLLDNFTLEDNIILPLVLAGKKHNEMKSKLRPLINRLGIADQMKKYPFEVSGGQKQRAAVARALINEPKIVLADEPTGALDSRASEALLTLFGEINFEGQTIVMVTHSARAASHAGRVLFLRDGEIYHQLYRGEQSKETMYRKISDTLTAMTDGLSGEDLNFLGDGRETSENALAETEGELFGSSGNKAEQEGDYE